jgi:outer membrane protein assembly factor BamB
MPLPRFRDLRLAVLLFLALPQLQSRAADWPMWRYDAARTASSPEPLAEQLHLQWTAKFTAREPVWDDPLNRDLMTFDRAFEPIAVDGCLILGFNDTDRLVALDAVTGLKKWTFHADGPIRLAPAAGNGRVYVCTDGGRLFCLDAKTGQTEWSFSAAPSTQKVLGNRRVISAWPARGGPVLKDGRVYFAASIWPFMGVFIYALDAETGKVLWVNDSTGSQYIRQPHGAPAFAGVAPQGSLVVAGDVLLVPGGRSVPAAFRRDNGQFLYFELDASGKANGGSTVMAGPTQFFVHTRERGVRAFDLTNGKKTDFVTTEPVIAPDCLYACETVKDRPVIRCYDNARKVRWELEADASLELIQAGQRLYGAGKSQIIAVDLPKANSGEPETKPAIVWSQPVDGQVVRLLAASERLFAVLLDGRILAFGTENNAAPPVHSETAQSTTADPSMKQAAERILQSGNSEGYAIWFGAEDESLLDALIEVSPFAELVIVDEDPARVDGLRRRLDAAGVYGAVSVHQGTPREFRAPAYIADRVFAGSRIAKAAAADRALLETLFQPVRPYGGSLHLLAPETDAESLEKPVVDAKLPNAQVETRPAGIVVQRVGALPGAADWSHQAGNIANTLKSNDQLVKLPLGLLWFGGCSNAEVLPRHGHGPPEQVVGGRLFLEGLNCLTARDVYTGRELWKQKFENLGTQGIYFDETYKDTPLDAAYNQVHIPGANARGTNFVATPDCVYVVEGPACHVLDARTGERLRMISMPQDDPAKPEPWTFVGVYNDVLLGGSAFANYQQRHGITLGGSAKKPEDKESTGLKGLDVSASMRLAAFDRHSGEVLWQTKALHSFSHNGIVAGDGLVYCLDRNPALVEDELRRRGKPNPANYRIVAFDHRTGAPVWQANEGVFGTWLGYSEEHKLLLEAGAAATDRLPSEAKEGMAVYRGSDGHLQWRKNDLKYSGPCIIHHDLIITNTNSYSFAAGAFNLLDGSPRLFANPLTGEMQPWTMTRAYGCNNVIASEYLLTFRSGAAGFFDLTSESGTGNLGGFKSGCTSNLVAANGILNAPDYTRTCSCAYQNQTSLGLVHMPDIEMWTVSTATRSLQKGQRLRQLGINFGAPGDRRAANGTLWVEYPNTDSKDASPLNISVQGDPLYYSHHASAMAGVPLPWVHASGVENARTVTIPLVVGPDSETGSVPSLPYRIDLFFSDAGAKPGQRVFDVYLQDKPVLQDLDIAAEAGQGPVAVVKTFDNIQIADKLQIRFEAKKSGPTLSGIELRQVQ